MIVVARTDEYTIYKKRNQRYAVRRKQSKQWLNGEDKVAVLLAHNLMVAPVQQAPEHPEAAADAAAEGAAEGAGEAPGGEAPEAPGQDS